MNSYQMTRIALNHGSESSIIFAEVFWESDTHLELL